jgi:hypothetical protein
MLPSSLRKVYKAFGIFRAHYLGEHKIPKLGGEIYDFIRQSYTGGRVDVFKPQGKDLYYYDVNSLYPTVYSSQPVPTGNPEYFKGNVLDHYPDAFGFFKCNITAPVDIKVPILQTHVETKSGTRTVAPLGSWTDVLFSEEMHSAIKYGYKITITEGFMFDKANIFQKYVNDIYAIKKAHSPSDPMYLISKLLLNSLYGRFGMAPILNKHEVIKSNELDKFFSNVEINIVDVIDLNNGLNIVSFINKEDPDDDSDIANSDISISIAASCTAYARVALSYFLNSDDYNVYYHDTDSIITDKPLNDKFVGKELGQLKLEYKVNKAVFLAPKVYSIITDQGKTVTKVKGFKETVSFEFLESLLVRDSALSLNQDKWFRDMGIGQIEIKNQLYSLKATENKRQFIFNKNNWNLRLETIKYCELDCKVLYQVISKFNDLIFNSILSYILYYFYLIKEERIIIYSLIYKQSSII